ncbi:MAG TPA: hypothetical protein EYQ81_00540 [Sneathiellales bacterium]|nr:hypothetical protein [Sneathiellales bacterium]
MFLGPWQTMKDEGIEPSTISRRNLLTFGAGALSAAAMSAPAFAGFKGEGRMNFQTGQEWIKTFFTSADEIITYYADDFVFEDATLFQTITDKTELHASFAPFENQDPDSPIGVHHFDVIRYDGGYAPGSKPTMREQRPGVYTEAEYKEFAGPIMLGDYEYDEWAVMNWIWKAVHNGPFLGLPAKGKSTMTRGTTFHCYKDRKIVREYTLWDFRTVAIQLGQAEPPVMFWKKPKDAA